MFRQGDGVPTSFTWSFGAFAHDLNNPPSMQSSCDVSLDLVNTIGVFQVSKEAVGSQTEYRITVQNPKNLGIVSDEQTTVNRASQDLVLACDIVLQRAALSVFRLEVAKPNVMMGSSPTQAVVKDTATGKSIEVVETVHLRDEVHITMCTQEALDETRAVQVSSQLTKLQRFDLDTGSTRHRANLINALHEYEAVMASLDRLLTFKQLYNVLEFVSNIDGINRDGSKLDAQMAVVSGASQNKCEEWRSLNNRTKHIHRDSTDVATIVTGMEKVTDYIPVMRQASGRTLADLLMTV